MSYHLVARHLLIVGGLTLPPRESVFSNPVVILFSVCKAFPPRVPKLALHFASATGWPVARCAEHLRRPALASSRNGCGNWFALKLLRIKCLPLKLGKHWGRLQLPKYRIQMKWLQNATNGYSNHTWIGHDVLTILLNVGLIVANKPARVGHRARAAQTLQFLKVLKAIGELPVALCKTVWVLWDATGCECFVLPQWPKFDDSKWFNLTAILMNSRKQRQQALFHLIRLWLLLRPGIAGGTVHAALLRHAALSHSCVHTSCESDLYRAIGWHLCTICCNVSIINYDP